MQLRGFARAMRRLMRRCDQMSRRYGADIYVLMRRNSRHYDYNSTKDPTFPTPVREIVSEPRTRRHACTDH